MSVHAQEAAIEGHASTHAVGSTKLFTAVWIALLVLTLVEVFLAYERLPVRSMLTLLMGLSVVKSGLIIAYFMHLKYEKRGLFFLLFPALIFCICVAMAFFLPDSLRLLELRPR